MNTDNQPKKKVSAFEYVFMKTYTPEKAKEYEPYTEQEELKQREDNLSEQFSKLRIKHEGQPVELPQYSRNRVKQNFYEAIEKIPNQAQKIYCREKIS